MIPVIALLIFVDTDWIAAGNQALDAGDPLKAAANFSQALDDQARAGAPLDQLLHLRVTLATAYGEAGAYREMKAVLESAQKTAGQLTSDLSRAELLNAWSALHEKLGQLSSAEVELQQAFRIVASNPSPGDILPAVLHNLASLEMRTARYQEAYSHERDALRIWEGTLNPDHPTLIRAWASLSSLQYMMAQPEDARVSLERALASAEKVYGPDHPLVADLLESEVLVLDKLKLKKQARQARARARQIRGMQSRTSMAPLTWNIKEPPPDQVHPNSK